MTTDLRQHLCGIGAHACMAKPMDRKELALALFPLVCSSRAEIMMMQ